MIEIAHSGAAFKLTYKNHLVLDHSTSRPCIAIGKGTGSFPDKHGVYTISEKLDYLDCIKEFDLKKISETKIILEAKDREHDFQIEISESDDQLVFKPTSSDETINRLKLRLPAEKNEAIYGCGEQFSEVNLRGKKVPLWCQEQGVGRGDPKWFTFLVDLVAGAGGDWWTTYFAQPTFLSSQNYYCHAESSAYAEYNFQHKDYHELYYWEIPERIMFGKFTTALETVSGLSSFLGRQPALPEWAHSGMLLGIQGGKEVVEEKLQKARSKKLKVTGVWCQDWQGIRYTSFGKQLMWNWKYDSSLYPALPDYIKSLKEQNIKFLGYINPFLALEGDLCQEASEKGYLVKNTEGEDYLIYVTTFPAALIDLTNPDAVTWIKEVIKEYMIETGLDGWMADFGEYLPIDSVLYSGESPELYHNKYPAEWARVNYEVLQENNKLDEIVFFTRSGFTNTSRYSTLMWAGDQLVSWSMDDGLASVIPAGISLGLCGIGYFHSDIGGYTTLGPYKRSKELFMRWAELSAFTMVMRSHEGNRPDKNWHFDSDDETLFHLAQMTDFHSKLSPYLKVLSEQYQKIGYPPIRACYLHYEDDPVLHDLKYQYLFGEDLLVAPVIKPNRKKRKLYLPEDDWVHLWSGKKFKGGWITIDAPLGSPPAFYRKESLFSYLFKQFNINN